MADAVEEALHFASAPSAQTSYINDGYPDDVLREVTGMLLPYSCWETATLLIYARFVAEFVEFAGTRAPPAPRRATGR